MIARVVRSGWFVGVVGGVLLLPSVLMLLFVILCWAIQLVHGPMHW